jgi:hypothetical protein
MFYQQKRVVKRGGNNIWYNKIESKFDQQCKLWISFFKAIDPFSLMYDLRKQINKYS